MSVIAFAAGDLGVVSISAAQFKAMRQRIAQNGLPDEIKEVKSAIVRADKNAEALFVLFGGQADQGAIDECVRLRRLLDETYARLALAGDSP